MTANEEGFTPRIKLQSGFVQGYGAPGYDWTKGIYDNRLLFEVHAREDSATVYRERKKWEKRWASKDAFLAAIAKKKLASPLCFNCGKPADFEDGGASNCLDKIWCGKAACRAALEKARTEHYLAAERQQQDFQDRSERDKRKRIQKLDEAMQCFHWRDGWYFRRLSDGSVRVMHRETPTSEWLKTDITIPAAEWASIVCSVSAAGETGERWTSAGRFHGESVAIGSI